MSALDDIRQMKDEIQASGKMLVKGDVWPYDSSRLLVIGSLSSSMDADALADDLHKYLGIVATPLPKKSGLSNLYSFVVHTTVSTSQLLDAPLTSDLIEACFGGETPLVDYRVAFVGLGVLESPVSPAEMAALIEAADYWSWSSDDETPIPFGDTDILPANTWVFLRADFVGMGAIPPKGLKSILESYNWNYKVINPLGGISGFFERVFSAHEYVGVGYSHVMFNPGNVAGVTAHSLQTEVFGGYTGGSIHISAFTTQEVIEGQGSLDTYYSIQGTEEGVGEGLGAALAMLQKLLEALPIVLWVVLGLGVAWVGWQGYKYIRDERKRLRGG